MSAPASSRPLVLLVIAVTLFATGCAARGAGRLDRPPADLPPSLSYVTADVLGYTLYDTDPQSALWEPLEHAVGRGDRNRALTALHSALTGGHDASLDDVRPWVGDAAGVALRQLDLDGETETSTLYFADVRDRAALERFLDDAGWVEEANDLAGGPGEDLALWTNEHECAGPLAAVCASPPAGRTTYRAVAVADDAVVAARSTRALRSLLEAADSYAVPDRTAMSDFTVEAARRVPVAAVFRFDLVRTHLRRPFEHDPALLEFARWATESNVLVALRDGWVGVAPPLDGGRHAVRVVGAAEWVPDLAPEVDLRPVGRRVLDALSVDPTLAVAVHDPGAIAVDLVHRITRGGVQYVTEQDVAEQDARVELLPVLQQLDGDAAIAYSRSDDALELRVEVDDPARTAEDVRRAFDHADLAARVGESDDDVSLLVPLAAGQHRAAAVEAAAPGGQERRSAALERAGRAPRPPVAWLLAGGGRCTGPAGGWVTWNGVDHLALAADVALLEASDCTQGAVASAMRALGLQVGAAAS